MVSDNKIWGLRAVLVWTWGWRMRTYYNSMSLTILKLPGKFERNSWNQRRVNPDAYLTEPNFRTITNLTSISEFKCVFFWPVITSTLLFLTSISWLFTLTLWTCVFSIMSFHYFALKSSFTDFDLGFTYLNHAIHTIFGKSFDHLALV